MVLRMGTARRLAWPEFGEKYGVVPDANICALAMSATEVVPAMEKVMPFNIWLVSGAVILIFMMAWLTPPAYRTECVCSQEAVADAAQRGAAPQTPRARAHNVGLMMLFMVEGSKCF